MRKIPDLNEGMLPPEIERFNKAYLIFGLAVLAAFLNALAGIYIITMVENGAIWTTIALWAALAIAYALTSLAPDDSIRVAAKLTLIILSAVTIYYTLHSQIITFIIGTTLAVTIVGIRAAYVGLRSGNLKNLVLLLGIYLFQISIAFPEIAHMSEQVLQYPLLAGVLVAMWALGSANILMEALHKKPRLREWFEAWFEDLWKSDPKQATSLVLSTAILPAFLTVPDLRWPLGVVMLVTVAWHWITTCMLTR